MNTQALSTPSLPALPGLDLQLEGIRSRFTHAHSSKGEERLEELKSATQEFEAVFVNYMLKVMRSTIEPADEETSSLGKDVYMGMFDNEISLDIARNSSMGIGDLLYRQLESSVKESNGNKSLGPKPPSLIEPGRIGAEVEVPSPNLRKGLSSLHLFSYGEKAEKEGQVITSALEKKSREETESKDHESSNELTWASPIEGALSSSYGFRNDPFSGDVRFHHGLDISAPTGTAIRAAQSGRVVFSGYLGGYGNTIILEHANGYRTLYGHAAKNLVNLGECVEAEQEIGWVGNTGRSKGTHLHFELQKGSQKINPLEFLVLSRVPVSS